MSEDWCVDCKDHTWHVEVEVDGKYGWKCENCGKIYWDDEEDEDW